MDQAVDTNQRTTSIVFDEKCTDGKNDVSIWYRTSLKQQQLDDHR